MKFYRTKTKRLLGTSYSEVYKKAYALYKEIKKQTKRRPYVRSAYFNKEKVFLELYWRHLSQKNWRDRVRRIRYFSCAIELIKHSSFDPESKDDPEHTSQIFHRFTGITPDGDMFRVQIKEDKRNRQKWLMSSFPIDASVVDN